MVREWVLDWFRLNGTIEGDIDGEKNYIDSKYIDSFEFINLISDCEVKFEIVFEDADFDGEALLTINGLINNIEKKIKENGR